MKPPTDTETISNPEIDRWYRSAREHGALGGKIAGAGGGGFLLLYCAADRRDSVRQALRRQGLQEMRFGFEMSGAREVAEIATWEAAVSYAAPPGL